MAERRIHYHYRSPQWSLPTYCRVLGFPRTTTGAPREKPQSSTVLSEVTCRACLAKVARYGAGPLADPPQETP